MCLIYLTSGGITFFFLTEPFVYVKYDKLRLPE